MAADNFQPPEKPEAQDDLTVQNEDPLWRRIPPIHLVKDENNGGVIISTGAFKNDRDGSPMSVVLGKDLLAAGRRPEEVIAGDVHAGFGLATFPAGAARECNQVVQRTPEENEPQHADLIGTKTPGVRKRLRDASKWVIPPKS